MRKTLLFLMLFSVKLVFSQVEDNFNDGDFTRNPAWLGDDKLFNINTNSQLQSISNSVSQNVSLSTINSLSTNVKWEFDVKLNFDPSATNQVRIYLVADQSDFKGSINGYFIQIGENGVADSYDLFRQNGTTVTKIIDGMPKTRANANLLTAKLQITRDQFGKWELFTAIDNHQSFTLEGNVLDSGLTNCSWFGVNCKYTASRSDGFFFDNFKISELVQDVFPPQLLQVSVIDDYHLEATFSESLDASSTSILTNYVLSRIGNPIAIEATSISNVFKLRFSSALLSGEYQLTTIQLKDLKGNVQALPNSISFFYVKPYQIKKNDLLISEVLFNPKIGGVDFIEIYNNTDQLLDLKNLKIANVDVNGEPANIKTIGPSIYMPAHTYWVLTTNSTIIKHSYQVLFPNQFIEITSMPAYNNDKGTVILLADQTIVDRFDYKEEMHVPLLNNPDGVSLERISMLKPANEVGNFTSAAMNVGFATPTSKNSVTNNEILKKNNVTLASSTFSPDGDGFEDLLQINYEFVNHGNFATINIYNDKGVLVKKLQRNASVSTEGNFNWNGLNDAGNLSGVGIYIVKFDTFSADGKTNSFKKTCVLASKLD